MAVPLMHLVPLIQGTLGVGAEAGGPLLLMLAAAVVGRVFFGRLADVISVFIGSYVTYRLDGRSICMLH